MPYISNTSFISGSSTVWNLASENWELSDEAFGSEMDSITLNPLGIVSQVANSTVPTFTETIHTPIYDRSWQLLSLFAWDDASLTTAWGDWH